VPATGLFDFPRALSLCEVLIGDYFRSVDFALSDLVNSRIFAIYPLVKYKLLSLIENMYPDPVLVFGADSVPHSREPDDRFSPGTGSICRAASCCLCNPHL
jgi:hypothetical protein